MRSGLSRAIPKSAKGDHFTINRVDNPKRLFAYAKEFRMIRRAGLFEVGVSVRVAQQYFDKRTFKPRVMLDCDRLAEFAQIRKVFSVVLDKLRKPIERILHTYEIL